MPVPLLEISFGKSPSANYEHAVHLAQGLPGYRTRGSGREMQHSVAWAGSLADGEAWERLQKLLQLVSGWNSARLKLAGRVVSYPRLAAWLGRIRACYA